MNDKETELLNDVIPGEAISNCCGAKCYAPTDEWAICMECKEHCDVLTGEWR